MITPKPHAQNTGFPWTDRAGTPRLLSTQQVADFDRDGSVLARGVIQRDVIDQLRVDIDAFESEAEAFLRRQPGGTMFIAAADQITFTIHLVPVREFPWRIEQSRADRQFAVLVNGRRVATG